MGISNEKMERIVFEEENKAVEFKGQIAAGIKAVTAVAEAIRELGTVPDGVLYANLMSHLSLSEYQTIIEMLVKAKLVTNNHHELCWIGPAKS